MGFFTSVAVCSVAYRVSIILSLLFCTGCQTPQPGMGTRLAAHVALVDLSGLTADTTYESLKVRVAVPHGWDAMPSESGTLYEHQQWRSPSRMTGVGVAYIHLPLPMSAKTLVWLAKMQYSRQNKAKHNPDPKDLGQWTDAIGREWFEGENAKFHLKGYVVTNGLDAWAVYSGYRTRGIKPSEEISMAFRTMDSIVPLPLEK